ncbi:D(1)-like dopamine receptor [Rhinoraja longicauda]
MWMSMGKATNHTSIPGAVGPELTLRAVTGCLLFLLILSTLLGNTLVCVAVIKFRHLRSKVTNSFVISLAVSDLFVAVLVMPWKALSQVAGHWLFGPFCDTWIAFDIMCSTASILNLCIISLDRYWAIASPFRYERKMTQRVAFTMIAVAWTLSLLISFIPVQLNWHKAEGDLLPRPDNTSSDHDCDSRLNRTYAVSSSLISFYIPVAIMLATYTRIYRIAQTQIRSIWSLERAAGHAHHCQPQPQTAGCPHQAALTTSFKKETKVLKTLSIIMGVFVCCWLPFFVLNCVVPFCAAPQPPPPPSPPPCVGDATFNIFVWFGWANSSLNPVIYAFNADFRKAFATILGCGRLCPGNAVEAVNFSNELASYHHDTTLPNGAATTTVPSASVLPNAALPSASALPSHLPNASTLPSHLPNASALPNAALPGHLPNALPGHLPNAHLPGHLPNHLPGHLPNHLPQSQQQAFHHISNISSAHSPGEQGGSMEHLPGGVHYECEAEISLDTITTLYR